MNYYLQQNIGLEKKVKEGNTKKKNRRKLNYYKTINYKKNGWILHR